MDDQRLIPLSALQHYAFCPRQCALIHIEQSWEDNFLTAQGQQLHKRVDRAEPETRQGVRYERGIHVASLKLGITGRLDLVEKDLATGRLTPVEYKRGKPKPFLADKIQLCAEALCLEEMTRTKVVTGALWYWKIRRRETVEIDACLREETLRVLAKTRQLLEDGHIPVAVTGRHCKACSLIGYCLPQLSEKDPSQRFIKILTQCQEDS